MKQTGVDKIMGNTTIMIKPTSYERILGRSAVSVSDSNTNLSEYDARSYQQKSVDELFNVTNDILTTSSTHIKSFNDFLLKAPTGSGKTIITGCYIDALIENYDKVIVLWISETPNLTKQSLDKLSGMFGLKTSLYGEDVNTKFDNHTVIGINWEKIKNTKAREDTERTLSIDSLVRDAKAEGMYVITVIDEAHSHADSKLSKEFLSIVDSDIVLNVTATPRRKYDIELEVDIQDVQEAGFIKQGIIVNDLQDEYNQKYRDDSGVDGLTEYFLHQSIRKRDELEAAVKNYADLYDKKPFVPLLVVQLPNNADDVLVRVEDYFKTIGINRDNGSLAVYMHDDYTDELDAIGKDENVKVLLFKQAISKGWDCPRASVITLLREPSQQHFVIQTIGRILRMPYLSAYTPAYDYLNFGYVYIEETENKVLERVMDDIQREDIPLTLYRKDGIVTEIDQLKKQIWFNKTIEPKLNKKVEPFINLVSDKIQSDNWFDYLTSNVTTIVTSRGVQAGQVDVVDLTSSDDIDLSDDSFKRVTLELSNRDIASEFERLCANHNIDADLIYKVFEKSIAPDATPDEHDMLLRNVLGHKDLFITQIQQIYQEIEEGYKDHFVKQFKEWSIPSQWVVPIQTKRMPESIAAKIPYSQMWLEENKLEKGFAEYLANDDNVELWYKNGDNGDKYFSIAYELDAKHRHFFPDFLVETATTLYVLETKGRLDSSENINKVESMKEYDSKYRMERDRNVQPKQVVLGYVKQNNGLFYMYTGDNFKKHMNGLDGWQVVDFSK